MREARAIAALNHPNICALYDVGDHQGLAFLVMELVEGHTLAHRLAGGPLPIDDVFDIAGQVAEAMRAAHERGILHRDLKPSNIILGARGAKVLDFGLAKPVADGTPLDASTATAVEQSGLAGTVHYMAPEQFRGQPATTASDVFAFGVLLHQCITGRLPFEGAASAEVMACILMKQPPACVSPLGSVPERLVDVVGRSLRKSPSDRWASFSELLLVLRTLQKAKRRPPARRPVARRLAVLPLEIAETADTDQQYLSIGLTDALIASLSRVQSLTVLAGASGARFSRRTPLGEIRTRLDADLVVDGVLAREADRLRITVRLGDTRTGSHPWSHTSEHPLSEAVAQFGDIAASIADQIQLNLTVHQRRRLRIAQTVSPEAQEAYLRGCHERVKRTPEGMRRAFPYLKAALESAPTYALAHVAMGEWYLSASFMRLISAAEELFRGRAAATEALRIDRTCADARVLLGMFAWFEWDRDTAVAEFARATALNPNLAVAYLAWSRCHLCIAQFDEAEERLGIAAKLDPLSPLVLRQLAAQSLCRGRYQEALRFGQETLQMNADDWHAPVLHRLGPTCDWRLGAGAVHALDCSRGAAISPVCGGRSGLRDDGDRGCRGRAALDRSPTRSRHAGRSHAL